MTLNGDFPPNFLTDLDVKLRFKKIIKKKELIFDLIFLHEQKRKKKLVKKRESHKHGNFPLMWKSFDLTNNYESALFPAPYSWLFFLLFVEIQGEGYEQDK